MSKTKSTDKPIVTPPLWGNPSIRIPILNLMGRSGAGKTTTACSIAPVSYDGKPTTLYFDFENSAVDHARRFPIVRVDLSGDDGNPKTAGYRKLERLMDMTADIKHGEYRVIVIDAMSEISGDDFFEYYWERQMIKAIGGATDRRQIRRTSNPQVESLRKNWANELASKCETLVIIQHLKYIYDKTTGKTSNRQTGRGLDWIEISTISLRLFGINHQNSKGKHPGDTGFVGEYWAGLAEGKNRIVNTVIDENGEAHIVSALPEIIRLENGETLPSVMRKVFKNPDMLLNAEKLNFDIMSDLESEEQRRLLELENQELENKKQLINMKRTLIAEMCAPRPEFENVILFTDGTDIASALKDLDLLDAVNDPDQFMRVKAELFEWGKARWQKKQDELESDITDIMNGRQQ